MPLPRALNPDESTIHREWFPLLVTTDVLVTGEIDELYNCLAWTIGSTNTYPWPGNSLSDFDSFYAQRGFFRTTTGPIVAYGLSESAMKHSAISGAGHGSRWESKCGSGLRFQHGLSELEAGQYGRIIAYYRMNAHFTLSDGMREYIDGIAQEPAVNTYLIKQQSAALDAQIALIPLALRTKFNLAFAAWKATWYRGSLRIDSNPASRRAGVEFDQLVALGKPILPMVIAELAIPANFFALQLYETLQANPNLVVRIPATDERILEGEQGRARRTVQTWFANQ